MLTVASVSLKATQLSLCFYAKFSTAKEVYFYRAYDTHLPVLYMMDTMLASYNSPPDARHAAGKRDIWVAESP